PLDPALQSQPATDAPYYGPDRGPLRPPTLQDMMRQRAAQATPAPAPQPAPAATPTLQNIMQPEPVDVPPPQPTAVPASWSPKAKALAQQLKDSMTESPKETAARASKASELARFLYSDGNGIPHEAAL